VRAIEPFGESADHRRRKHMRQLDEGITTEGFTLGSIKSDWLRVRPAVAHRRRVHVGEAGAGHQRYGRIIVFRKRDVPVPSVPIVTRPVLVHPAVTIGRLKQRTLRVHTTAAPPHD
jgi:hypothetical protein